MFVVHELAERGSLMIHVFTNCDHLTTVSSERWLFTYTLRSSMRTSPRRLAAAAVIAATSLILAAPAAHAVIDPSKMQLLESVHRLNPIGNANCATFGVADPLGPLVPPGIPPGVPLVDCLAV
jgi:hypothetical protein